MPNYDEIIIINIDTNKLLQKKTLTLLYKFFLNTKRIKYYNEEDRIKRLMAIKDEEQKTLLTNELVDKTTLYVFKFKQDVYQVNTDNLAYVFVKNKPLSITKVDESGDDEKTTITLRKRKKIICHLKENNGKLKQIYPADLQQMKIRTVVEKQDEQFGFFKKVQREVSINKQLYGFGLELKNNPGYHFQQKGKSLVSQKRKICIPYIAGDELTVDRLNKQNIQKILLCLTQKLLVLHLEEIIHGDLKTKNIILTKKNKIHIIDFDFSKKNGEIINEAFGNLETISPEIFYGKAPYANASQDIYSLGCVFFQMLSKNSDAMHDSRQFLTDHFPELGDEIIYSEEISFSDEFGFTEKQKNNLNSLVITMLSEDITKRPLLEDIYDYLETIFQFPDNEINFKNEQTYSWCNIL